MPDSRWTRAFGVDVHYTVKTPSGGLDSVPPLVVTCLHGFGSNEWSFSRITQELADELNAVVSAHDTPGFGLTQRWVWERGGTCCSVCSGFGTWWGWWGEGCAASVRPSCGACGGVVRSLVRLGLD